MISDGQIDTQCIACMAVITTLKNLSELIGLPKLTKENGNLFNVGLNLSRQIPMKNHP